MGKRQILDPVIERRRRSGPPRRSGQQHGPRHRQRARAGDHSAKRPRVRKAGRPHQGGDGEQTCREQTEPFRIAPVAGQGSGIQADPSMHNRVSAPRDGDRDQRSPPEHSCECPPIRTLDPRPGASAPADSFLVAARTLTESLITTAAGHSIASAQGAGSARWPLPYGREFIVSQGLEARNHNRSALASDSVSSSPSLDLVLPVLNEAEALPWVLDRVPKACIRSWSTTDRPTDPLPPPPASAPQ